MTICRDRTELNNEGKSMNAIVTHAGSLVRYDAACRALADAKSVDEVKELRDIAEALRAYARQAKNRQLEMDAAEIRIRAERRLGEMLHDQKETVGFNRGAFVGGTNKEPPIDDRPTLAEAGIDKKLSSRAQKLAEMPEKEFESRMGNMREGWESEQERISINLFGYDAEPPRSALDAKTIIGHPRAPTHVAPRKLADLHLPIIGPTDWVAAMKGFRIAAGFSQLETDERSGMAAGYTGKLEIDIRRDWNESAWDRINGLGIALIPVWAVDACKPDRCPCCGQITP